jgi:predicted AlkP superfamily pyrophosphatase or phosphodiesterase
MRLAASCPDLFTAARRSARTAGLLAVLALAACASPAKRDAQAVSQPAFPAPVELTILISIDGMPADMLGTGATPTVDAIAAEGVHAAWMTPSQPTATFPNHYTLVTGLRPDRHGIVHNIMTDETLGRFVSKQQASAIDGRWWGGEPIWATYQKQGGIAATMFWPGSEARIAGELPHYRRAFDSSVPPDARSDQLLLWLDLPAEKRPRLLTLYFEQYDVAAHGNGTRSPQAMAALREVDSAIARLRAGLHERGLLANANIVVVSDHGMADLPPEQRLWLEDMLDTRLYHTEWWGTFLGLRPKPGQTQAVERVFLREHPHFQCWRKHETPPQWHFGRHPRIPPIVCQMQTGWGMLSRENAPRNQNTRGEHGFEMSDPSMRAVFAASGPSLCRGVALKPFDNIDLYPFLAHLLRVKPAESDGRIDALLPALRDKRPGC